MFFRYKNLELIHNYFEYIEIYHIKRKKDHIN